MRSLKFLAVLTFLCGSCLEPYSPEINADSIDALVVDGHIDSSGEGTVLLSRAIPLYKFADTPKETGATVSIESSTGENFSLPEITPGHYTATSLPVNYTSSYTLRVQTANGREYKSDTVRIHQTPNVDKIYFAVSATGNEIEFRSDAIDLNKNTTGFYAFECIETYEYRSQLFSRFKRINGMPVQRHHGEYVDTCWIEVPIPMSLASTGHLSQNKIVGHRLTSIPRASKKISRRYSILVKQRTISEQEYNYRVQLEKTNNQQGGIFAEIPGSVVSNVFNISDRSEIVLGYFRGQEVKQLRYFIGRGALPEDFQVDPPPDNCDTDTTCPTNMPVNGPNQCIDIALLSESKVIITSMELRNSVVYVYSTPECGDCTASGGKATPPDYWY